MNDDLIFGASCGDGKSEENKKKLQFFRNQDLFKQICRI
jgi:hypothetical protein